MSSTMRLFVNNDRISTAVKINSGILQVYPTKRQFASDAEWKQFWEDSLKPKIEMKVGSGDEQVSTPEVSAPPVPSKPKNASLTDWNFIKKSSFTFTVPAGKYYIGDLCYALSNDIYDNIFGGTGYESGIYEEKGTNRVFALAGTAWGDGEYPGSDGNNFSVDAGIIGICSVSLMAKSGNGGYVYTFNSPVTCKFKNGRFSFVWEPYDSLIIDTTGDDDAY